MSRTSNTIGIRGYRVITERRIGDILQLDIKPELSPKFCPHCACRWLRSKGRYLRRVRHLESFGRITHLRIHCRRFSCRACKRSFVEPLPGILPGRHSTEPFRQQLYTLHHEGIPSANMGRIAKVAPATVSRIYAQHTQLKAKERISLNCPRVLGIDEHTLHKKKRFATTFCDLAKHRVFDVAPGKSIQDLLPFLCRLKGRHRVKVVCIDLSSSYRNLVRRFFPNAQIVADRFHVVRIAQHHFMEVARKLAPELAARKGRLGLLRKAPEKLTSEQKNRIEVIFQTHPVLRIIHDKMHEVRGLLNQKHQTKFHCRQWSQKFLALIQELKKSAFEAMHTLAKTFQNWKEEIARMWRFTRNNGITEGFHRKMKLIQRRAYGIRNFENYRLRVIAACG